MRALRGGNGCVKDGIICHAVVCLNIKDHSLNLRGFVQDRIIIVNRGQKLDNHLNV
jgi:hypothetical protein